MFRPRRKASLQIEDSRDESSLGRISDHFRNRRMQMLLVQFPHFAEMRVLDLGGTPHFWHESKVKPAHVTIVNLDSRLNSLDAAQTVICADACSLEIDSERFDLVFSNSLLEHLGGFEKRLEFAKVIDRYASHHWIQTPNRFFPVEPHWRLPIAHYLPLAVFSRVANCWPFGYLRSENVRDARGLILGIELLSLTEMRFLFPHARIVKEKVLGLSKSFIAVR